jgi:hypothetical protein
VAGSLRRNYTWQDHSVGITRGGITQSEYFPKGPQSHRGLSSRGGITQSELHVAGSLSLNISLKVPNPTGVSVHVAGSLSRNYTWRDHSVGIARGGIAQPEYFPEGTQSHRGLGSRGGITQSELHVEGSLSLNISLNSPIPQRSRFMWQDHSVGITRGGITQSD